jgi:hypothetical protein
VGTTRMTISTKVAVSATSSFATFILLISLPVRTALEIREMSPCGRGTANADVNLSYGQEPKISQQKLSHPVERDKVFSSKTSDGFLPGFLQKKATFFKQIKRMKKSRLNGRDFPINFQ